MVSAEPVAVTAVGRSPSRTGTHSHHSCGHIDMHAPESTKSNVPALPDNVVVDITSAMKFTL
eukprot:15838457-Heterocapsa_arctica.AAC.1